MPICGPRSRTTGANTGTVMKMIAIHSMNVPSTTRIAIITNTVPSGERPSPCEQRAHEVRAADQVVETNEGDGPQDQPDDRADDRHRVGQ